MKEHWSGQEELRSSFVPEVAEGNLLRIILHMESLDVVPPHPRSFHVQ